MLLDFLRGSQRSVIGIRRKNFYQNVFLWRVRKKRKIYTKTLKNNVSKGIRYFTNNKMSLLFGYSSGLETIEEDTDMNRNRIIDLPSPTTDSEPVTKGYADTHYSGGSGQQGPKGDKGDTGSQGPQGPKGNTGSRDPKGDTTHKV